MNFPKFLSDPDIQKKFQSFYDLVMEYNGKFNLTAITDENEFLNKHILDSISSKEIFTKGASVVEIGSGAGFPSVPLKIVRPDLRFTLVESNEKKCGFLEMVAKRSEFCDFNVVCSRAEELSLKEGFRDSFDYSVARAVAPLNVLCELTLPFVKEGGYAIAYKGAKAEEEIKAAENAIKKLGGEISFIKRSAVIDDTSDHSLITIKKIAKTPFGYPRRYSKIKKCPI